MSWAMSAGGGVAKNTKPLAAQDGFGRSVSASGDLNGALKQLDQAVAQVRMSLAMAALAYCRHPVSGKLKVLPAMQLLQGDQQLSSANARRLLNSLRGRAQNAPVDTEELHSALDEWQRKESERRGTP